MTYADGKKKYKKVKVRDVVIVDCDAVGIASGFVAFDASFDPTTDPKLAEFPAVSCAVNYALILNAGFRMGDTVTYSPGFGVAFTRQAFVRKRTVRVPKVDNHGKDHKDEKDD